MWLQNNVTALSLNKADLDSANSNILVRLGPQRRWVEVANLVPDDILQIQLFGDRLESQAVVRLQVSAQPNHESVGSEDVRTLLDLVEDETDQVRFADAVRSEQQDWVRTTRAHRVVY